MIQYLSCCSDILDGQSHLPNLSLKRDSKLGCCGPNLGLVTNTDPASAEAIVLAGWYSDHEALAHRQKLLLAHAVGVPVGIAWQLCVDQMSLARQLAGNGLLETKALKIT